MTPSSRRKSARLPLPDQVALVLQGGGALGAYQVGVYEALDEAGIEIDRVAGISIGAVNAAIIAGNPPEKRVERPARILDADSANGCRAFPSGTATRSASWCTNGRRHSSRSWACRASSGRA